MYSIYGNQLTEEKIEKYKLALSDTVTSQIKEWIVYKSLAFKVLWRDVAIESETGDTIIIESETDKLSDSLSMTYEGEQCRASAEKFINQIDKCILDLLFKSVKPSHCITTQLLNFDNIIQDVFEQFIADGLIAAKVLMNNSTRLKIIEFSRHKESLTKLPKRLEGVIRLFGNIELADVHCLDIIPENKILVLPPYQYLGAINTVEEIVSYPNQETSSIQILSKGVFKPTIVHPERIRCIEVAPDIS